MKPTRIVVSVAAVLAALLLAASFGTPPAVPAPPAATVSESTPEAAPQGPSAPATAARLAVPAATAVGAQRVYRFELRQSGTVGSGDDAPPETFAAVVRGRLRATLWRHDAQGSEVLAQLEELTAEQAGGVLTLPVDGPGLHVQFGADGFATGYRFAAAAPEPHANLLRILCLRLHQVPSSTQPNASADDETGKCEFQFRYETDPAGDRVVERRKLQITTTGGGAVPTTASVQESLDRIVQRQGRTARATCHEVLAIDAGGVPVHNVFDLTAECIAQAEVEVSASAGEFGPWATIAPSQPPEPPPPSFADLLAALAELERHGELGTLAMQRWYAALVERFRADGAAVDELVQRLLSGELAPPQMSLDCTGLLVAALADAGATGAGHAGPALVALLERLPNGAVSAAVGRALHALADAPAGVVQPVLAAAAQRLRHLEVDGDATMDLTLAIGALLRGAGAESAAGQLALQVLHERRAAEGSPLRLITAVAESRHGALILSEVLPFADAESVEVRLRVVEALALVAADPRARSVLQRLAEHDPDDEVRRLALASGTPR